MRRSSSFTFQLFIYESLSIEYHYQIKRTRDVVCCIFPYECYNLITILRVI